MKRMGLQMINHNHRLSIVTILLATIAFSLVITSVIAFLYVTRKEKLLRKLHLIVVILILLIELALLVGVIVCSTTPSRGVAAQILAVLLILLSFLVLMTLIYFLLEDVIRDKIQPYPTKISPYRSYEVEEINTVSRHVSPIPTTETADEAAVPINSPPTLSPLPRLPTPPPAIISPVPVEKLPTPPPEVEKLPTPPPEVEKVETPPSPLAIELFPFPQDSPFVVDYNKVRRDLIAAIEERAIPALEEAIQQVKDHDYIEQLKYECERALELLNRLMKIEHMKIRVLRLNQSTISELHSYTKPPEEVSTVMRATFLLLGHSDKEIQDWTQIQNLLGRLGKDSVRRRCYELNPLYIPVDKAHEAKDILRNYDLIRVSEISVGLAAFFSWAVTMVEEREKLVESQHKIVR